MRVANLGGRLHLVIGEHLLDVATASEGRFSPGPQHAYERWAELREWADGIDAATRSDLVPLRLEELDAPVPAPTQVFAIALNYKAHVLEAGRPMPVVPGVFTKFGTCLTGPAATIFLPAATVDWEVELVVVMGRPAFQVPAAHAWDYVAGLTVGQDLSERELQLGGTFPQLALAKSMPGFGPLGPVVVSPDELADPSDLYVETVLNGVQEQSSRTSDLVFDVPTLIEFISARCAMRAGDLIFTGTPGGVGASRTPPVFLKDGDVLVTRIEGIGELRNTLTVDPALASGYPAAI